MILGLLVATLLTLSCLGYGALAMRAFGATLATPPLMALPVSFALGFGILGWLTFPLALSGHATQLAMALLCAAGLFGTFLLPWPKPALAIPNLTPSTSLALLLLFAVLALFLIQASAPPVDGDSMAYHFARIKATALAGKLEFLPQAIEGTGPMLSQMTYLPAYLLGGEPALTFWTAFSGFMTAAFVFALSSLWLSPLQSLTLALIFLTTPAVVFGLVSGQVEVRNALFVLGSTYFMLEFRKSGQLRCVVLAGILAGLFAAAKVFGLLWALVIALPIIIRSEKWLMAGIIFGLGVLAAGFEWYAWTALMTGDPIFPMMHKLLGVADSSLWTNEHLETLKKYFREIEQPVVPGLAWLFYYPIKATLDGFPVWESSRTGFGPFGLVVLPFAFLGIWRSLQERTFHPLWAAALPVGLFYVLWFYFGSAQRLRHLLPLYPLLLVLLGIASFRAFPLRPAPQPLKALVVLIIAVQLAGLLVFSKSPLAMLLTSETRDTYLARSIPLYDIVPWLNKNLGGSDRLLLNERQLLYQLDVSYFFAHPLHQAQIDLRPSSEEAVAKKWMALKRLGVTHVLLTPPHQGNEKVTALHRLIGHLRLGNCVQLIHKQSGQMFASHTLRGLSQTAQEVEIYALTPNSCFLSRETFE